MCHFKPFFNKRLTKEILKLPRSLIAHVDLVGLEYGNMIEQMPTITIIVFVLGYLAITLEHNLHIDKLIPALAMMAILWAMIALGHLDVFDIDAVNKQLLPTHIEEALLHHLGKTAEILVFLIGAMTIVEIVDYFNGFSVFQNIINFKTKKAILWVFSGLAFILSAIIDNLTATIVLILRAVAFSTC